MKLLSVIFVASVTSTLAAERGLQTLAKKWNIVDPGFTYDDLSFDLDYQVSDFIQDSMTLHEVYTSGCKEAGTVVLPSVLTSSRIPLTGAAYNAGNNGNGVRDQKLTVGVVAAAIAASDIYVEDTTVGDVTATIDFCVRFSLLTTGATEVNFLETLVTLFVDLSDGFSIGNVTVAPKLKLENTANQVYLLDGYQCDAANAALTGHDVTHARKQGAVIRVCVKPDAEAVAAGIKMRSLDEFTFTRDTTVTQEAIIGYNQVATNGLTSLTCTNGVDVCVFETILFAAFYTSAGTVSGSGTGSMQFGAGVAGARRLRALQADTNTPEAAATSEFELDFGVNDPAVRDSRDGSGAAASSGVMAGAAVVMAGAFAFL